MGRISYNSAQCSLCDCALKWRHNGHDGVSNHQPHQCLLNRLFGHSSKKTSKLRVTGLCVWYSPGPVNSPHKWPVTRNMFPFDDVIMEHEYITVKSHRRHGFSNHRHLQHLFITLPNYKGTIKAPHHWPLTISEVASRTPQVPAIKKTFRWHDVIISRLWKAKQG